MNTTPPTLTIPTAPAAAIETEVNPNGAVKGRVLIVFDPELGHTTFHVRGMIFREQFAKHGWHARFLNVRECSHDEVIRIAREFDVLYLLRVNSFELVSRLKRETAAKVAFDLTDALWRPYHREHGWWDLEKIMATVDAIYSENEAVCLYGRVFNRVYSIPVVTNSEQFAKLRSEIPPRNDGLCRIGWMGSTGTFQGMRSIEEALLPLFARYPQLELRIIGLADRSLLGPYAKVRHSVVERYDEGVMLREILQMDIGLFPPPVDREDYCIRGALKALLYMQGGVPPVCLNAGEPAQEITDGVTGMLCDSTQEWSEKIERLILNPELRRAIGERARERVTAGHELEVVFKTLEHALLETIHR